MADDLVDDGSLCPACGQRPSDDDELVTVDVEYQGKVPLLVFHEVCSSCGHEWRRAVEPIFVPEEIRDLSCFVEFTIAEEKKDRVGAAEAVVPPAFFFFHGQREATRLIGAPHHHSKLDDKDVLNLVVRMLAQALVARGVLQVTTERASTRCPACGTSVIGTRECRKCGTEIGPSSESPCRDEMLVCTLSARRYDKVFVWTSRLERGADGRIAGFQDQIQCDMTMETTGRLVDAWSIERWMQPHIAVNMPAVLKSLGMTVDDKWIEAARVADRSDPSGCALLRLDVADLASVVKRIRLDDA